MTEPSLPTGLLPPGNTHRRNLDDPKVAELVFSKVAEGIDLELIAKELDISRRRLMGWLTADEKIAERYQLAVTLANSVRVERVRRQLEEIAFFDFAKCFDPVTGDMLPPQQLPREARMVVLEYDETETNKTPRSGAYTVQEYKRKYKLYNRIQALELLGKEQRMFVDRVEHDVLTNPYKAKEIPVTPRLPDPDAGKPVPLPSMANNTDAAIDAEFTPLDGVNAELS